MSKKHNTFLIYLALLLFSIVRLNTIEKGSLFQQDMLAKVINRYVAGICTYIKGDPILKNITISRSGMLTMKSGKNRKIISYQNSVSNLTINNPLSVKLHGDFKITEKLTIDAGTLMLKPS